MIAGLLLTLGLGMFASSLPIDREGWWVRGGSFEIREGEIAFGSTGRSFAVLRKARISSEVSIELTLRMTGRRASGWAFAGAAILFDESSFWHLALVESPDGTARYAELVEMHMGRWQAQGGGETALRVVRRSGDGFTWEWGKAYKLRLRLTEEGISGEVIDPSSGAALWSTAYAFDSTPAVRLGRPALTVRGADAIFSDLRIEAPEVGGAKAIDRRRIGVVCRDIPGIERGTAILVKALEGAGFEVEELSAGDLARADRLNPDRFGLLLLPESRFSPQGSREAIYSFLSAGGRLLCLGGPPFSEPMAEANGRWMTRREYERELRSVETENLLFGFEDEGELEGWSRATNDPSHRAALSLDEGVRGKALKVEIENLTGWDTFYSPDLEKPFPEGHTLTCFWAKGDGRTDKLAVEWEERDGSRWIAVVPLSTEWGRYVLTPDDFEFWPDCPARGKRGFPGDRFNPQNARRINFGLAFSHTGPVGGRHAFWVDEVGTAPNPLGELEIRYEPISLEGISPPHKLWRAKGIEGGRPTGFQALAAEELKLDEPVELIFPVERNKGLGFGKPRELRWIPLLWAVDAEGRLRRAALASLTIAHDGQLAGSAWGYIGLPVEAIARNDGAIKLVVKMAEALAEGIFLCEGGSRQFAYFPGEEVELGAKVINLGGERRKAIVRISVRPRDLFEREWEVEPSPGEVVSVSAKWRPPEAGVYEVEVELIREGRVVDRLRHEFRVVDLSGRDGFVRVEGGEFVLKGEPWVPFGVNFWPRYVIGTSWEGLRWMDPWLYDPESVAFDLKLVRSLGMNMVSASATFTDWSEDVARNLVHFLETARELGLKVNLFLPGADPMSPNRGLVERIVREARLAENDAIFAYDIAWEPRLGSYRQRRRWDAEWRAWIEERYGSLEEAERVWGFKAPRDEEGRVTAPSDEMLKRDGPWRAMVADYWRFADDLIDRRYGEMVGWLRRLDPNHLIGSRTGFGGNGNPAIAHLMPFDLKSSAAHLDFISPEGWNLRGSYEQILRGGFNTAYARAVGNGKPVFWAEFGLNILKPRKEWEVPELKEGGERSQAEHYERFFRMIVDSRANGCAAWWFPGGYRVDERSDFGIVNPDGTAREVCEVIRRYAPLIKSIRPREPDVFIEVDRTPFVTGYAGVFERWADRYVELIKAGRFPGVVIRGF